jgi:DNA-binding IscR family transcriptional regulator
VTENGIQVVVVSNEPLSLPFSEDELVTIKDSVAQTFMAVAQLSAISPTVNTVGKIAVSTAEVAELVARNERQVRSHLSVLSSSGLLRREGARGGWILNASLSA